VDRENAEGTDAVKKFEPQMDADERRWEPGMKKGGRQSAVMTYPVYIKLTGRRHDFVVEAADGTRLAKIRRRGKYSRFWFAKKHFKKCPPADGKRVRRRDFLEYHRLFNPARIVGYAVLLTPEARSELDRARALEAEAAAEAPAAPMMLKAYDGDGSAPAALRFESISANADDSIDVTVAYPADMRSVPLEVVGCTDLRLWNWCRLFATNCADNADGFSFHLPPAQSRRISCYRTDMPAGDSDGDGLLDGRVKFYSRADDGDNDFLPDWWELQRFGNLNAKPFEDYDNDWTNNLAEYLSGGNPTEDMGLNGVGDTWAEVTWPRSAGYGYYIEHWMGNHGSYSYY
jgi:hypothetical protein